MDLTLSQTRQYGGVIFLIRLKPIGNSININAGLVLVNHRLHLYYSQSRGQKFLCRRLT